MKKIINGTTFELSYSSNNCTDCDANHDHAVCGQLAEGFNCESSIWKKEKLNKNKLKNELEILRNKYDNLSGNYIALQKVHEINESALRSAERALDKRSEYQIAIAEFVGQVIVDVANKS